MSAQLDPALVHAYSQSVVEGYISIAATCKYTLHYSLCASQGIYLAGLFVYEFLITFVDEIKIIWKRPVTASTLLLGSVRWCTLLSDILQTVQVASSTANTAFFSALRVFTIWNKSYVWSLLVFALSLVPFITNMISLITQKYGSVVEPLFGLVCITEFPFSAKTASICTSRRLTQSMFFVVYTTRGSLILADAIVLTLTWIRTFRHWRNARRVNVGVSLTTCLLRDGTIYFIALLATNVTQLLTYNVTNLSLVGPFLVNFPPVLINRFMINLKMIDSEVPGDSTCVTDQQQGQSTVQFRQSTNRLGNIGGTLQSGWDDDDEFETWDQEPEDIINAEVKESEHHENSVGA
ncbi:uncharacterized protein PHACADRAFT_206542 [Phanerochaete carnosa HHB-10118-sp]|uniref:DUF6533 domain-containing protein n=1 Tax=Phanerochaete carnosa (strain HHB-10118-sp) TaxID=650164 RepID=K5V4V3_PHACS|nr:uncharacterized protein PHACADRAFT_206542 [Phanerochaete carnosa HHB-10118-sp]EKM57661.1 hypothetical protein PHACADRAFT_206542 [Phanerochaete carnosa HHB-10118-sp]